MQKKVKVVAFAAFGEVLSKKITARRPDTITPTFFQPKAIINHSLLAFTKQEAEELVNIYSESKKWFLNVDFCHALARLIWSSTKGHTGLFFLALHNLDKIYGNAISNYGYDHVCYNIMSQTFFMAWVQCRACRSTSKIRSGSDEAKILDAIGFSGGLTKEEIEEMTSVACVDEVIVGLVQQFVLVENVLEPESMFDFPSPLIRACYLRDKFGVKIPPAQIKMDFDEFLNDVFAIMDGKTLKMSLSKGKNNRLLEAAYQYEFYQAATRLLGSNGIVSCEVGALFSIKGRIDFWINDERCWAIELLRDGDRLEEHVARMEPDGKYGLLTKMAKDMAVIDFRGGNSPLSDKTPPDGVVYAVFDKEFQFVTVTKSSGHSRKITLIQ